MGLVATACSGPTGTSATAAAVPSPGASNASPAAAPTASPAASEASPAASTASPAASTASPAASTAEVDFTGGTATATVTLPGGALTYAGGSCEHGPADAWVAVNIGQPNGAEYFGLIAGRSPYSPTDVRTAAGGGTLKGDAVLVTYRRAGSPIVLDHDSASVFLVVDASGGTFSGHLADGTNVSGKFAC